MVIIREATKNDLLQILDIYNDVILHTTAVYHYQPHTLEMRTEWFESRKKEGFPIFVATENGTILGLSTIGPFRAFAAYKYTVENTVHVASHARGRGIGKLLMPPIIDAAIQMNMHTIVAGIDAANDISIHLHKNFGFEEVAYFKQVGYKFGRWLDLKFMQLILPTPANPEED